MDRYRRGDPTVEITIASPAELAVAFRRRLETRARAAVARRGRFAVAIPGGSVASTFLPALATSDLPWPLIDVFWADERVVPADSAESNLGLARRLLFGTGPAAGAVLHPMVPEVGGVEALADAHNRELRAHGPLDLIALGVGEDGHVASLFPGYPALAESDRWVVAVAGAPKPPPERLTLTLPAIRAAREVLVAAFGAAKAGAIRSALEDPSSDLPVARVLQGGNPQTLLLDPLAAPDARP